MALSSNTLIHFTKNLKSLKGILENNFKLSYCREKIYSKETSKEFFIPMVSFCDIPFSQIISHVNNYGSYGIGLRKSWAESNGLNPVLYVEKNSSLSHSIVHHTYETVIGEKTKLSELSEHELHSLDYIRYLKNYQADLHRKNKIIKDYRFSDEREWRYVAKFSSGMSAFAPIKEKTELEITNMKKKINERENVEILKFTPDDINYIIIKKETERDGIIKLLEMSNGKYSHDQVKRLTSRVISVEQLKTDF